MTALKAHVRNGRIVVDEAVDLPEGAEVRVYLYDIASDSMGQDERDALETALQQSIDEADAGELVDADVVLRELQHRS